MLGAYLKRPTARCLAHTADVKSAILFIWGMSLCRHFDQPLFASLHDHIVDLIGAGSVRLKGYNTPLEPIEIRLLSLVCEAHSRADMLSNQLVIACWNHVQACGFSANVLAGQDFKSLVGAVSRLVVLDKYTRGGNSTSELMLIYIIGYMIYIFRFKLL
jgi:hypothetical protein